MATDESVSPPYTEGDLKQYFEDIVSAIEKGDEDGEKEFCDFCNHHSDKVKDLVSHEDDRTDNLNWKFMGRSLITRKTFTLLHYAVAEGCNNTVKLLISKGADPAAVQEKQGNAFHFATMLRSGDEMLKTILDAYSERHRKKIGSEVFKQVNFFSWTSLFYAIKRRETAMVKYLLENGADAREVIEEYGSTAFLFTAKYSSAEILKIMVEHYKLEESREELEKIINETKRKRISNTDAEFDKFDGVGLKTLYFACNQKSQEEGRSLEMVKKLLSYGADPTLKDERGQTGLHYAVQCHDESILENMLQNEKIKQCKKTNLINEKDNEGHSPLWYAFFDKIKKQPKIVEILMKNGASITKSLSDLQTREKMLRTLIESKYYAEDLFEAIAKCLDKTWFENEMPHDKYPNCNLFLLAIALDQPAKLRILLHAYETILVKLRFQDLDTHIDAHLRKKFPYHIALKYGCSPEMIDLLQECKCTHSNRDEKDPIGNTPLHCLSDKTCSDSLKKFMDIDEHRTKWMLRQKNRQKKTPLDIAIKCKRLDILRMFVVEWKAHIHPSTLLNAIIKQDKECSEVFVTCGENIFEMLKIEAPQTSENDMEMTDNSDYQDDDSGEKPFIQLIKSMPDMAIKALDHCLDEDKKDNDNKAHKLVNDYESKEHPLEVMVKDKRNIKLLQHPVVAAVIKYKWITCGLWVYVLNLLTYIVYLGLFSALSQILPNPRESVMCSTSNGGTNTTLITNNSQHQVFASLVIIFAAIRLINEVIQFFLSLFTITKERKLPSYLFPIFNKLDSYLELFIFISAIVIGVIVLPSTSGCLTSMTYNFAVFIVALSWINLILFLSKLPFTGLYALIFINMVKTFLKLAIFALLLVIGSTLVLVMLFSNPQVPGSPFTLDFGTAMVKVITMVTGELGFEDIFGLSYDALTTDGDIVGVSRRPLLNSGVAYFMWIIFLVFMPILLSNMLTGLAVGDVEKIIKDATFTKIKDQVDFMMNIEHFMSTFHCKCYKEVKHAQILESCIKFLKLVLWDDEETEDTTPKNFREIQRRRQTIYRRQSETAL